MAGDWIKVEHNLPSKTEVFGIAKLVGQNRPEVVGRLIVLWSWADETTTNGADVPMTESDIDELVGTPGFARAMRQHGWLLGRDGALQFPNFERHNGTSAKARALESEAKRLRRLSVNCSGQEPENCPTKPAANVRPEKRRVFKKQTNKQIKGVENKELKDIPKFTPAECESILENGNAIYRRIDPTHYPWIAMEAELAVRRGHLSTLELEELIERCSGGHNFGNALKDRLGENWLTMGRLKVVMQSLGIPWKESWEKPFKAKQMNGAQR